MFKIIFDLIKQVISFLTGIGKTITSIGAFIINAIESLLRLMLHLPEYISTLTQAIAWIPSIYQGIIVATIGISLIFLITGRGK